LPVQGSVLTIVEFTCLPVVVSVDCLVFGERNCDF